MLIFFFLKERKEGKKAGRKERDIFKKPFLAVRSSRNFGAVLESRLEEASLRKLLVLHAEW